MSNGLENHFAVPGNGGSPEVESGVEKQEHSEDGWSLELINDEINYFQEMVDYLRSIEQINDEQAQKERGKIEKWEEKFKQQLKEKANYETVRAKLRKAGNALTQRFVRANVQKFTKKTGVVIPYKIYDGEFFISESPDNADSIARFIRNPDTKVRKIRSLGAALMDEGVQKIADALKDPDCKVTELALENDGAASSSHEGGITTKGALAIAEALSDPSSKIRRLGLAHNRIGEEGANAIARAIQLPHSQVQELNLMHNFLEDECSHEIAEAIKHSNLGILNLWMSQFGVDGVREIAEAIKTPGNKLHELSISGHFYGKSEESEEEDKIIREGQENQRQGIKILLEAAHHQNSLLEELRIENQLITNENALDIANLIKDPNSKVRKLGLYWNEIGDDGIKEIAEALRDPNSKIKEIDLRGSNKMTGKGEQILKELKKEKPGIKIL